MFPLFLFLFSLRKVKADVIITFCVQAQSINKKYSTVIERWNSLLADSANRENRLLQVIYLFFYNIFSVLLVWFQDFPLFYGICVRIQIHGKCCN